MAEKIKILVCGAVRGQFKQLFQRVENVNRKVGKFEALLCVGDFFNDENNEDISKIEIPIPTYILGPNSKGQEKFYAGIEDGEICLNLTYLGKRGVYILSSGVKICYLSGIEDDKNSNESFNFNKNDILSVCNMCLISKNSLGDYKGIDILITAQSPYGIDKKNSSKLISHLCKEIKPRYHFCGLNGTYSEPGPYRLPADHTTQLELCTHFVSLAAVGNIEKQKYIYALNITPVENMRVLELIQKTTNEKKYPFDAMELNCNKTDTDRKQYFFDMNPSENNRKRGSNDRFESNKKRYRNEIIHDQEKCWFCLSSPQVEKHLVISIGDNFYLALAKGPVNEYHVLILSVTHIPSASLLSSNDWKELIKFKKSIQNFFKEEGLVTIFTERFYKSSHMQINAIGIDKGYVWKIKHAFEDKAEEQNLRYECLPSLTDSTMLPQNGPYFVAELPDNTTLLTRQMKRFPLHFAREVFCSENLLNCEEKIDWKKCTMNKTEEIDLVKKFRNKYSKYDFTL